MRGQMSPITPGEQRICHFMPVFASFLAAHCSSVGGDGRNHEQEERSDEDFEHKRLERTASWQSDAQEGSLPEEDSERESSTGGTQTLGRDVAGDLRDSIAAKWGEDAG